MVIYEIRVAGHLDQRWSAWFGGLLLSYEGETTLLRGPLVDEAALYGVLMKVRNLGVPLLSVNRLATDQEEDNQARQG